MNIKWREQIRQVIYNTEFLEVLATQALHYIYSQDGTINEFLENYGLIEEFYIDSWFEYFGFNEYGDENE